MAEDTQKTAEDRHQAEETFRRHVLPILQEHCFECHSHDADSIKGGLVLDSRSGWAAGGDSGPAVIPGRPQDSLLMSAVRYEDYEMPPSGRLPPELIKRLEQWVADGAADPRTSGTVVVDSGIDYAAGRQHWAFQPMQKTPVPDVQDTQWSRSDVDRYVLAALEQSDLQPVGDADSYTWLRRVTFDLTGLPPTVEQIQEFAADSSQEARAAVVDRLLSSRAFGERWARHWLDLVGYADQIGTSNNVFAEHAWRYRDYVIDALNNDVPYDRFIRDQIAGDLQIYDSVQERANAIAATGFLVLGDMEIVEADKEKMLVDIIDQQLTKTGQAFLGLTLGCARCHDHKFDPVSQHDYYAMAGFFHGTSSVHKTNRGVWSDVNISSLPETADEIVQRQTRAAEHTEKLESWKQQRSQLTNRRKQLESQLQSSELTKEQHAELVKERDEASQQIGSLNQRIMHGEFFAPDVPEVYAVHDEDAPEDMHVTIRGNPRALGEQIPRGFLKVIADTSPDIPTGQSGRRELADWIASPANPLPARVAINRIWQKLFGEGLVRTVDYFGLPADTPSHPELLDHLALKLIDSGWSQKTLIRSLVLSRTYALDSTHSEQAHAVDPDNRLLWRMNRIRLDAEAMRDAMLCVSGQLRTSTGGPAIPLEFPENVGGLSPTDVNPPHFRLAKWRPEQQFERTIYLPVIRSAAQPGPAALRNVFDFAQPSQFTGKRPVTAVPTQALFLMNSPVVRKHAVAVAERMSGEPDDQRRLQLLWLTLLNRPLTEAEQEESTVFLNEAGESGWVELCHALLASNEFLMRL